MSRDELIVVVRRQAGQIRRAGPADRALAGQLAQLMEANEALAGEAGPAGASAVTQLGELLDPPSKDDDPGKPRRRTAARPGWAEAVAGQAARGAGVASGVDRYPNERRDRFPEGRCDCGDDLAGARDLGVVDRYQQHEIPQVAVTVTQYDQHRVECGCGAATPPPGRTGPARARSATGPTWPRSPST